MGSKTLENDDSGSHGHAPDSEKPFRVGGEPRGARTGRHGDGGIGDGAGDGSGNDDDDDDEAALTGQAALTEEGSGTKSKKKRKPRKKKKKTATKNGQTSPPRVKVDDLFPSGEFPKGEWQEYGGGVAEENTRRTTDAEVRYGRLVGGRGEGSEFLRNYRKAAEVHRQVRRWVQDTVKPGDNLTDIAVGIEDGVRALLDNSGLGTGDGLKSGMGFPTGLSVNHGVAHYTPNPGQKEVVLGYEDVVKVDFGVHINGWIVDSAFTIAFDPTYDNLLAAVKDATNSGIKAAGVDVRICDISAVIQETMESYEVEIRGKTFPVKPVRNLSAHDIHHYHIHGNKSIPFVKNSDQTKMEEGEVFAIETFGSTGRGFTRDDEGIYGYGLDDSTPVNVSNLGLSSARRLYKTIKDNFGTIVFCRRYLDRLGQEKYLAGMNSLIANGIVEPYKPLMDIQGSYSAQFEHTILLRETGKEVISRGEDY